MPRTHRLARHVAHRGVVGDPEVGGALEQAGELRRRPHVLRAPGRRRTRSGTRLPRLRAAAPTPSPAGRHARRHRCSHCGAGRGRVEGGGATQRRADQLRRPRLRRPRVLRVDAATPRRRSTGWPPRVCGSTPSTWRRRSARRRGARCSPAATRRGSGSATSTGCRSCSPVSPSGWPPSEVSLGRLLSDAGYRTAMIGKWHCGDQPAFLPTQPRVRLLLRPPVQQRHGPPGRHADGRARRPARLPAVAAAARRRGARAAARPGVADRALPRRRPARHPRPRRAPVLPVPRPHVRAPADLRPGALRGRLAQRRLRRGGRDASTGSRR